MQQTAPTSMLNSRILELFEPEAKIMLHLHRNEALYEYPTLHNLWSFCRANPEAYVYYFHSKGIMAGTAKAESWRRGMEHFVLLQWRDCVEAMNKTGPRAWVECSCLLVSGKWCVSVSGWVSCCIMSCALIYHVVKALFFGVGYSQSTGAVSCGIDLSVKKSLHYSGNFWWARCEWVKQQPR